MKAIIFDSYGSPDVLQLRDVDGPVVDDGDVLIRVHAASANPYDWHFMRGKPYFIRLLSGLRRPKNNGLGADLAGQVEAVGKDVTRFRPGDEVFGLVSPGASFAEYVCTSEDSVERKPANLTFEQAAAVPMAGLTALQGLRNHGGIEPRQKVLINGASGGVGTFAVQIAKSFGAEVIGVCSTRNVDMVRSIGADRVLDYTCEDFTRGERRYDLMLDNAGNRSLSECRRVLEPDGTYVLVGAGGGPWLGPVARLLWTLVSAPFVSHKVVSFVARRDRQDLLLLKELLEAGRVTPVIDKTYPLSETREAIRYLETGHARGKVVITI